MRIRRFLISFLIICITLTSLPFVVTATPSLKEGNYEKWIDRVELPSYAIDLYDWFSDNSKEGGALRTAVTDTLLPDTTDEYAYKVTTISKGNITFSYSNGSNNSQKYDILQSITADEIKNVKDDTFSNIHAVYASFVNDHPEIFWLAGSVKTIMYTSYSLMDYPSKLLCEGQYNLDFYIIIKSSDFDIRNTGYQSTYLIDSEVSNLNNRISEILSGGYPVNGTRLDKLRYFNKFLTETNCYNISENLNNIDSSCRNCLSALYGKTGTIGPVCSGYAKAFKVLCDKVGIPCVLSDGNVVINGIESVAHMWNYVQMENGKWYGVDVTWNDPTVKNVTSAVSGYECEDYFLIGSGTEVHYGPFGNTHPPKNQFFVGGLMFTNGPILSEFSYELDLINSNYLKIISSYDGKLVIYRDEKIVTGFTPKQTSLDIIQQFEDSSNIRIVNKADNVVSDNVFVGTGCKVQLVRDGVLKDELTIVIKGEIDGNGIINSEDAIYLLKYTLFPDLCPVVFEDDIDGDGLVDCNDAIYLLKHTLFADLYPLE